jgi:carbonic anhydrase
MDTIQREDPVRISDRRRRYESNPWGSTRCQQAVRGNRPTIRDQGKSVCEDVQRLRSHPLVPRDMALYGYIHDVKTVDLQEVLDATRLGKAA